MDMYMYIYIYIRSVALKNMFGVFAAKRMFGASRSRAAAKHRPPTFRKAFHKGFRSGVRNGFVITYIPL